MANYHVKFKLVNDATDTVVYKADSVVAGATLNGIVTKEYAVFEELTGTTKNGTVFKIEPETTIAGLSEV